MSCQFLVDANDVCVCCVRVCVFSLLPLLRFKFPGDWSIRRSHVFMVVCSVAYVGLLYSVAGVIRH